ncbi:1057_t:CDS:2 [Acaulospora morrowiae]|uniref:1057_t:CDS:1 n=1 Tax=Acaulospora morrowiae TaxID=94023 RepID=A0A9N8VZB3_9GLOM|nr:1057_t:CDS:2 [Acaulospora morrowiae]
MSNDGPELTAPTTPPSSASSNVSNPSPPSSPTTPTPLTTSLESLSLDTSQLNNESDEDETDELLPSPGPLQQQKKERYLSSPITISSTSPLIQPLDNARSAASISNLINHDEERPINSSSPTDTNSPTSQMSSRSISPAPETPRNNVNSVGVVNEPRFINIEFHNTNNSDFAAAASNSKKRRKGGHDHDDDGGSSKSNRRESDSSKRQRRGAHKNNHTSSNVINSISPGMMVIDENDEHITLNDGSIPPSPVPSSGFDEMVLDDQVSDDFSGANSPTSTGGGIFAAKQNRKKPYIPRPPNSFILYRQHHHPLILNQHPGINNSEISRIIADHWRKLSDQERDEWKKKAEEAKEKHMKAWPDYKYQPRRRVVGPTFKKPLKGPGAPTTSSGGGSTMKSDNIGDFELSTSSASRRHMSRDSHVGSFVLEVPRKPSADREAPSRNDLNISQRDITDGKFLIVERGPKELNTCKIDRKPSNRKPSTTETLKAQISLSHSAPNIIPQQNTTRLPPPHTLVVPPPIQTLPPTQAGMILPTSPPPSTHTARGALIVLEGCEDVTTSLQSTKLLEFLKNEGIKASLWKFPDTSTPSGTALKAYQSSNRQPHPKTYHLLVAAHWWELMPIMREHLLNGTTLIVDRYVYSAIAKSAAAGLDLNWCKNSYVQLMDPDLIFFLNVERDFSADKEQQLPHVQDVFGGPGVNGESVAEDGRRNVEWQKRMQDAFGKLAEVHWKILDACKSNTLVHAQILEASIEVIERCRKFNPSYGGSINNNLIMQNPHLPPLGPPTSSPVQPYPLVNLNGAPNGQPTGASQSSPPQQGLPPIGRHDGFPRSVHVQL